jgi:hypothetical protein
MNETPVAAKRGFRPFVLVGVGVLAGVLVALGAVVFLTRGSAAPTNPGDSTRATAIEKCESAVKDQLKSPGSAKFSGVGNGEHAGEEPNSNTSYTLFELQGNVDSENEFGASLRSTWTCQVGYNPKTKSWGTAAASVTQE